MATQNKVKVMVAGQDITSMVTGYEVECEVGDVQRVHLDLVGEVSGLPGGGISVESLTAPTQKKPSQKPLKPGTVRLVVNTPSGPKEHIVAADKNNHPMPCHGCASSASAAPFPGFPSGERPCCFCIRNVEREEWKEKAKVNGKLPEKSPYNGYWYDGSKAVSVPMDCYRTMPMMDQMDGWMKKNLLKGLEVGVKDPAKAQKLIIASNTTNV